MLADLLQEIAELKRTIEKNEKVLLKKSYWENHLSRKIEKLKEENKKFKADTEHTIKFNNKIIGKLKLENDKLKEENKKIKADYIKLSKIVETTGGYKASYVNELRDKIAKLEFDIEALHKLKA